MSSIIKNLEKGLYEFTNYFKVSEVTDVPDPEVRRIIPYRGTITNSGDLIEAGYINMLAQAGVWWMVTTKDTTVSAYDKFTTDITIDQTLVDGLKFKTAFPITNNSMSVKVVLKSVEYPVKKVVAGGLLDLSVGDISVGAISNLTFFNGVLILEGENLASATVPGIITEQRVTELANIKTNDTLSSWCPFPIGAIYMSTVATNPSTFWTGTVWQAYATGKTIVGIDTSDTDFNTVNKTGGVKNVALTTSQLPSHTHTISDNTHSHGMAGAGNHTHTTQDHSHYIPPHQHVVPWGESNFSGPWGHYGNNNQKGHNAGIDSDNNWFYVSPTDQVTNGSGGLGMTWSEDHAHGIYNTTHSHTIGNIGDNATHTNLQPYITTYIWRRIS